MGEFKKVIKKALPIMAYGNSILRQVCNNVQDNNTQVEQLIADLWYTLEISGGLGLAAPQINSKLNVFVVNSTLMYNDLNTEYKQKLFCGDNGIEEVFINAKILAYSQETDNQAEGCLSIPGISNNVDRSWNIIVEYRDKDFVIRKREFSGYTARVIQHEYDHTQGKLFIDYMLPVTKKILKAKLRKVIKGHMQTNYPINYLKS